MSPNSMSFKKGDYLLHQSEVSRHMFVIKSGKVRVMRHEGKNLTFSNDVSVGGTVGELSLIDSLPRSASALALEDVEANIVRPSDLEEANTHTPVWFQALARSLAHRIRNVLSNLERNPDSYAENSVASLLVYYSIAENEKTEFSLSTLTKNMSEILRFSPYDVEFHLKRLRGKGWVKISQNKLEIPNLKGLENHLEDLRKELASHQLETFRP